MKTYRSNIQTGLVVRNIHVYTQKYRYIITVHVQGGHEFEREEGYMRGFREEKRKRENCMTITLNLGRKN